MISRIKKHIPRQLLTCYHFFIACLAALYYRFPSRNLVVVGVTGTKGKTSTAELLNSILESAGYKTAVLGTLRFKIGEHNERNLKKMTMPGRFFVQKLLRDAVNAGCTHAVIEMTSEGAKQFRQRFIAMDALIFTNLSPEHIESHGSYEKYRDAKLSIARTLARSSKKHHFMVANKDDKEGDLFLSLKGVEPKPYSLADGAPVESDEHTTTIIWRGKKISSQLLGRFNAYNIIAAATCAEALGTPSDAVERGISGLKLIQGRAERIEAGQKFPVIVDYAHTPDSLTALYEAFKGHQTVCVLGNTGGGRDKWKRPTMGHIAETYCTEIILTDEDPYDEDPSAILEEMRRGITTKHPTIILDRRMAIAKGIAMARQLKNPALLITGKGTDPYIMGPNGTKTPWDDRGVAREELARALS